MGACLYFVVGAKLNPIRCCRWYARAVLLGYALLETRLFPKANADLNRKFLPVRKPPAPSPALDGVAPSVYHRALLAVVDSFRALFWCDYVNLRLRAGDLIGVVQGLQRTTLRLFLASRSRPHAATLTSFAPFLK